MVNQYIKYLYIPIIITLIIVLIVLFVKLTKLMKNAAGINEKINSVNSNIEISQNKIEEIEDTKQSWHFFFIIYIVLFVIKDTMKDYKRTARNKRKIGKSFAKVCTRNASKIRKIKI